jgi:hypothetical protein
LYDIGNQDGVDFLVMEYSEGQTLADRLQKGALPIEQVLKLRSRMPWAKHTARGSSIVT